MKEIKQNIEPPIKGPLGSAHSAEPSYDASAYERIAKQLDHHLVARIPIDIWDSLTALAKLDDRPISWEVRQAILAYLEKQTTATKYKVKYNVKYNEKYEGEDE